MAKRQKRTIARFAATCTGCGDPVEVGMAVVQRARSWQHVSCMEPWLEGRGPRSYRRSPHPQAVGRSNARAARSTG